VVRAATASVLAVTQDRENDEHAEDFGLDDDDFELNDDIEFGDLAPDDLVFDDEDIDLKEAFGLPDRLPPLRLPTEPELAATARTSPLLARVRRLAEWAALDVEITDDGDLTAACAVAAARELGIALPAKPEPVLEALPGMPDLPAVTSMRDVPELARLWDTALDTALLDFDIDGDDVLQGESMRLWPDGSDEEVLDFWSTALPCVLDGLQDEAVLDESLGELLDFSGAGLALMIMLFLARQEGLPVLEASDVIREAATEELAPATGAKAWRSWTRAHGDPTQYLLGLLAELGAVSLPDQPSDEGGEESRVARLTPLGTWAFRALLVEEDVEVPLLPPPDQMTAADLVAAVADLNEEDMEAETAAWLEPRQPDAAAAELLAVAADGGATERMLAVAIVQKLGAVGETAWRDSLARPELRPYAKIALTEMAGVDPAVTMLPGLEPDAADVAWLTTDTLAAFSDAEDELPQMVSETIPPGQEQYLFDAISRSPHPDAAAVLSLVGKHHPDKQIAKAARGSAHRARTRLKPVN
jgi:hypothetical protein